MVDLSGIIPCWIDPEGEDFKFMVRRKVKSATPDPRGASLTQEFEINGTWQPASGESIDRLPERERTNVWYEFFTEGELQTEDEIKIEGEWFKVSPVGFYSQVNGHTEAMLSKVRS